MNKDLIDQLWDSFQFLGKDKEAFEECMNAVYVEANIQRMPSTFHQNMQLQPDY